MAPLTLPTWAHHTHPMHACMEAAKAACMHGGYGAMPCYGRPPHAMPLHMLTLLAGREIPTTSPTVQLRQFSTVTALSKQAVARQQYTPYQQQCSGRETLLPLNRCTHVHGMVVLKSKTLVSIELVFHPLLLIHCGPSVKL
jgi:hypothetical protein